LSNTSFRILGQDSLVHKFSFAEESCGSSLRTTTGDIFVTLTAFIFFCLTFFKSDWLTFVGVFTTTFIKSTESESSFIDEVSHSTQFQELKLESNKWLNDLTRSKAVWRCVIWFPNKLSQGFRLDWSSAGVERIWVSIIQYFERVVVVRILELFKDKLSLSLGFDENSEANTFS